MEIANHIAPHLRASQGYEKIIVDQSKRRYYPNYLINGFDCRVSKQIDALNVITNFNPSGLITKSQQLTTNKKKKF